MIMAKPLNELITEKLRILDNAEIKFLAGMEKVEKDVYRKVLGILRNFSQKDGKLILDEGSNSLLVRLRKEILGVIRKSGYVPRVNGFLTNFDSVEKQNRTIYQRIIGKKIKTDFTLEKKIVIDTVTDSLTSQSAMNANFTNQIRANLVTSVRNKLTFKDAEENLKRLVLGTGKGGLIKKYTGQVVVDSINQFDGEINDVIRDAFSLNGFRYVGSLIKDSRQNCKEWVNGSGRFKKYAVRGGTFRTKDLPAMIRIARNRPGWIPGTTPENFGRNRGGYRCRHGVYYFRLTKEENQKVADQLS